MMFRSLKSLIWSSFKDPKQWNPNFHIKDFMYYQTILLKAIGMCDIEFENYLPKHFSIILNWFIFGFLSSCHIHLVLLYAQDSIRSNDLARTSNAITMVVIHSFAFVTILFYKLNHKKYLNIVEYMNEKFLTRSAYGLTFLSAERSYIVANRHTFWWTYMCVAGTLQWCIIPFFSENRILPINIEYPFNALVSLLFLFFFFLCLDHH